MVQKLVSIIIPAYNYGAYLGACLQSLQQQSYTHWEVIVIDNGSTDNTADVIKTFAEDVRIRYYHQENLGVSAARNRGFDLAQGEFIQLLDADDLLQADKLQTCVQFLETQPQSDLVYTGMRYFKSDDVQTLYFNYDCDAGNTKAWMKAFSGKGPELVRLLLSGNNMVISSPLFRKTMVQKIGPFDASLKHNEDWEFWLRAAIAGCSFSYLESANSFSLIRVHQKSASAEPFNMFIGGYQVLLKHRKSLAAAVPEKEVDSKLTAHLNLMKSALLESNQEQFERRTDLLTKHGLLPLFFPSGKVSFFGKLALRFKTF